MVNKFW